MPSPSDVLVLVLSFGLGSLPFGVWLPRLAGLKDVRASGSSNPGATNVARQHGMRWGALVLLCDALKGGLAVGLAAQLAPELVPLSALFAVTGHLFSPWLGFAGGKGVATGLGVTLAALPLAGLAALVGWLIGFWVWRRSSVGALCALTCLALASLWLAHWQSLAPAYAWVFSLSLPLLVLSAHKDNIKRLSQGEEPRMQFGSKEAQHGR